MTRKSRVDTLKAVVLGSGSLATDSAERRFCNDVNTEFERVQAIQGRAMTNPDEQLLLQVLCSARGLYTYLTRFCSYFGYPNSGYTNRSYSLDECLGSLTGTPTSGRSVLNYSERLQYQYLVETPLDRFMHWADEYPSEGEEVDTLLGNIHDCLFRVAGL